jgi:hypothetical protein
MSNGRPAAVPGAEVAGADVEAEPAVGPAVPAGALAEGAAAPEHAARTTTREEPASSRENLVFTMGLGASMRWWHGPTGVPILGA